MQRGVAMKNRRKQTPKERLYEELRQIERIENTDLKKVTTYKLFGKIDLALEYNMITYKEWEYCVSVLFNAL